MTATAAGSILLSSEVEVEVNRTKFFGKTAAFVFSGAAAFLGDFKSGGDALNNLAEAASAIEVQTPIGTQLWQLIVRSVAWTVGALTTKPMTGDTEEILAKSLVEKAKSSAGDAEYAIDSDFLTIPSNNSFYRLLRDQLSEIRLTFRAISEDDEQFKRRFDVLFNQAVFEIFARQPSLFTEAVRTLASDLGDAARVEADWNRYRAEIQYDFNGRPVFGQEDYGIALSQLYTPLRCIWRETKEPSLAIGDPREANEGTLHVEYLQGAVQQWLSAGENGSVFLIGGGPGSGKSTSARAIANEAALDIRMRPLFVPLQRIDAAADLRDAVNRYFSERSRGLFSAPPLDKRFISHDITYLLIFDGLDELAQPGEAADYVTGQFVIKLMNLLSSISSDKIRVRAIVTGRLPSFQSAQRHLGLPPSHSVEVIGYASREDQSIAYPRHRRVSDPGGISELDQRHEWWAKYAALKGLEKSLPPAMSESTLSGITNEPLLCYLLVLADFIGPNWELAAENANRIYEKLIVDIWQRGWGEGSGKAKRQGPGRTLKQIDFVKLMETIALAAWLGGDTRVCTERNFLSAIAYMQAEAAWEAFRADNGEDVTNLAMNFYLKSAEESHRGFEFTHKSFGEYLTSRAILSLAYQVGSTPSALLPLLASSWVEWTGSGQITGEILDFLRAEALLEVSDRDHRAAVISAKRGISELLKISVTRGMTPPAHRYDHWRKGEALEKDAEIALWAAAHSLAHALYRAGEESSYKISLELQNENQVGAAISRLCGHRPIILKCLLGLDLSQQVLIGLNGSDANFTAANLDNCLIHCCTFWKSTFERASMKNVYLSCSTLQDSKFDNAEFIDAHVSMCFFPDSNIWDWAGGRIMMGTGSVLAGGVDLGPFELIVASAFSSEEPDAETLLRKFEQVKPHLKQDGPR